MRVGKSFFSPFYKGDKNLLWNWTKCPEATGVSREQCLRFCIFVGHASKRKRLGISRFEILGDGPLRSQFFFLQPIYIDATRERKEGEILIYNESTRTEESKKKSLCGGEYDLLLRKKK